MEDKLLMKDTRECRLLGSSCWAASFPLKHLPCKVPVGCSNRPEDVCGGDEVGTDHGGHIDGQQPRQCFVLAWCVLRIKMELKLDQMLGKGPRA